MATARIAYLLLLALLLCGCPQPGAQMSESQVDKFIEVAQTEMNNKNQLANERWKLDEMERFDLDQDTQTMVFTKGKQKLSCKAQIVGSYSKTSKTWMWGWANQSVVDALKKDALRVQTYGFRNDIAKFKEEKWEGTEADAWAMAAVARKLSDAEAVYRAPHNETYVFLTLRDFKQQ